MAVRIDYQSEPIPGYRLLERLGGGGFGEVWKCEAPGGLLKAIKFVYGSMESAGEGAHRAEQEFKALNRVKTVRHPYILSLERFDIINGQLMIVMELADRNLWDRFRECRSQGLPGIPRDELLNYMAETAEALDLMNLQYQLQHLDIKPQNLFLVYSHVKVADFGLVKDLEGRSASVTGGITPVYAAPETFDGWVSRFSDQYSLAIVYQELLTGQRPFSGTNVRQLILQHLQSAPDLSSLSPGDQAVIGRALSKNPDDRYPTCAELVTALREAGETPSRLPMEMPSRAVGLPARPDSNPLTTSLRPGAQPASDRRPVQDQESVDLGTPVSLATAGTLCCRPEALQKPAEKPLEKPAEPVQEPGETPHEAGANPPTTRFIRKSGQVAKLSPAAIAQARQAASAQARPATPEAQSEGVLFPTLVVGLGGLGLSILGRFRFNLHDRHGALEALPHLRTLLIDTDPEAVRLAQEKPPGLDVLPLAPAEMYLAPLNRPTYYLKPQTGKPPLESWFPQRMLYRIPRQLVTTGARALGRLALVDNYKALMRRLRADLEAILNPDALKIADRNTGLGIRASRPRVYLVGSLMGGTAGGMLIDLAYAIRHLLRELGVSQPDVVGVFLLPPTSARGSKHGAGRPSLTLALGNAHAALKELRHYSSPGVVYHAAFSDRDPPLQDSDPPLNRCVLLPLPDPADVPANWEAIGLAGQFLALDCLSPVGKASDLGRAGINPPPWSNRGQYFQTFGLHILSFPRQRIVRRLASRTCSRLVAHWMSKDAQYIADEVRDWVGDHWKKEQMGPEYFIGRVQEQCSRKLGKPPELAFTQALEPLIKVGKAVMERSGGQPTTLPLEELNETLLRLERLVGSPETEDPDSLPTLVKALRDSAASISSSWSQKLAELPVRLIEEPAFRLAGAEEAVRKLVENVELALRSQEPLLHELSEKYTEVWVRLQAYRQSLIAPTASTSRVPWARKSGPLLDVPDVLELLRNYVKWRYHWLTLSQVTGVYVSLRGHLTDELREINFCRTRLSELQQYFDQAEAPQTPPFPGLGNPLLSTTRELFPEECKDVKQAVDEAAAALTREDLLALDEQVQQMLRKQFRALVAVCMASSNQAPAVAPAMQQIAEAFFDRRLPRNDVAGLFLSRHAEDPKTGELQELASVYEEARPELVLGRTTGLTPNEFCVLAAPPSVPGETLKQMARATLHEVEIVPASTDDIILYREWTNIPLSELEHLGPVGQESYRQLCSIENFTPHSRMDIAWPERE